MPPSRSYSEAAGASTSASSRSSCGPFRPAVDELAASRRDNTKSRQDDERRRARELSAPSDYRFDANGAAGISARRALQAKAQAADSGLDGLPGVADRPSSALPRSCPPEVV